MNTSCRSSRPLLVVWPVATRKSAARGRAARCHQGERMRKEGGPPHLAPVASCEAAVHGALSIHYGALSGHFWLRWRGFRALLAFAEWPRREWPPGPAFATLLSTARAGARAVRVVAAAAYPCPALRCRTAQGSQRGEEGAAFGGVRGPRGGGRGQGRERSQTGLQRAHSG